MGRKYNCNYDYFKEIDTEDKSYWLGFLYADGSIHKTKHTIDLVLSINEKEHLYKFNNYLESTYPIKIERDKYVKLTIHNNALVSPILPGIFPKKKFNKLPNGATSLSYVIT